MSEKSREQSREGPREKEGGSSEKEDAAHAHRGQAQEPRQADEESSTTWDTEQHSDAPGPFGTADED